MAMATQLVPRNGMYNVQHVPNVLRLCVTHQPSGPRAWCNAIAIAARSTILYPDAQSNSRPWERAAAVRSFAAIYLTNVFADSAGVHR